MGFRWWKGQTVQPSISSLTLIAVLLVLGGFIEKYNMVLLVLLGFQLIYLLNKGALLAGKKITVVARNTLNVIIPLMLFAQELNFFQIDDNIWMVTLIAFAALIGLAFNKGTGEKR
jgi:hypothetical protein